MFIAIAIYGAKDVRPVLKAYEGKNIPIEYGKQEAEAKRRFIEEWRRSGKSKSGSLTISGLFGGSQGNVRLVSEIVSVTRIFSHYPPLSIGQLPGTSYLP